MAILHRATLRPSKPELLTEILGAPVEIVGAYRFDDPEGEVGVEGFVVRAEARIRQIVLTYRAAPLGEDLLPVGVLEHSVLGTRWVYRGEDDPVALGCFARALAGEQQQAGEDVYDGEELVESREPSVRVELVAGAGDGDPVLLAEVADAPEPRTHLLARWKGGSGVVATAGRAGPV